MGPGFYLNSFGSGILVSLLIYAFISKIKKEIKSEDSEQIARENRRMEPERSIMDNEEPERRSMVDIQERRRSIISGQLPSDMPQIWIRRSPKLSHRGAPTLPSIRETNIQSSTG